jgi:hypothetical protein
MDGSPQRDDLPDHPQVNRSTADAGTVEQVRSLVNRVGPVALTALGIFGAMLMIFAGLVALNHTVLPFEGWPLNSGGLSTGRQTLPRAPAETGRLRTASGGTLAEITDGRVVVPGPSVAAAIGTATTGAGQQLTLRLPSRSHPQRARSHSSLPPHRATPAPVIVPQPVAAAPVAVAPAAPAPVQHGLGHGQGKHAAAVPIAAKSPSKSAPATEASAPQPVVAESGPGKGHGHGHAGGHDQSHGNGQGHGNKGRGGGPAQVGAPVPSDGQEQGEGQPHGNGQGQGNGPPPWANGKGKHS